MVVEFDRILGKMAKNTLNRIKTVLSYKNKPTFTQEVINKEWKLVEIKKINRYPLVTLKEVHDDILIIVGIFYGQKGIHD